MISGLGLTVWLIFYVGAPAVGTALRAAGLTGLLAVSAFHLVATTLMGLAWWRVRHTGRRRVFLWGRLVRDAGSEVLPLSQIGGYVLGARVLVACGFTGTVAAAVTVVDTTLEFSAQIAYTALGLSLLMWLLPGSALAMPVMIGLGAATLAALALVAVQSRGSRVLARVADRLAHRWLSSVFAGASAVQAEIRRIYREKRSLVLSFLLHFCAWLFTGAEAWLALRFLGASLSPAAVLTLESLLYATRAVSFMVPNALGIQEGAYVVLGAAFGLTPDIALSLSLLKRGRDLVLGIPALVSWQAFETRKRRRPAELAAPIQRGHGE